jgi:hypothetical protein
MSQKYTLATIATLFALLPLLTLTAQAGDPVCRGGDLEFSKHWAEQDQLVGSPGVDRPYTWGPSVPGLPYPTYEDYNTSNNGIREVHYFDKARMEQKHPYNCTITAGLLTKELVSGMRQDSDNFFTRLAPSRTQVAGDAVSVNPDTPVYESFKGVVTLGQPDEHSRPNAVGQPVTAFINKAGQTSTLASLPENIIIGAYEGNTGHNIAKPFQDFKQLRGPITDLVSGNTIPNQPIFTNDPTTNVFGLAISEPYWVSTRIAGIERTVLVQLFERRVLTYNPAIMGTSKVEMGNLGQHYYQWRYVETANSPREAGCLAPADGTKKTIAEICVSNSTPALGDNVTVDGRLIVDGIPVVGAEMYIDVRFKTYSTGTFRTSGSDGIATWTIPIKTLFDGKPQEGGYKVVITGEMTYKGQRYPFSTSFTIQ